MDAATVAMTIVPVPLLTFILAPNRTVTRGRRTQRRKIVVSVSQRRKHFVVVLGIPPERRETFIVETAILSHHGVRVVKGEGRSVGVQRRHHDLTPLHYHVGGLPPVRRRRGDGEARRGVF